MLWPSHINDQEYLMRAFVKSRLRTVQNNTYGTYLAHGMSIVSGVSNLNIYKSLIVFFKSPYT